MPFPERIREIRKELGQNQKEMAEQLGIGYRTFQRYEEGKKNKGGTLLVLLIDLAMRGYNLHWVITGDGDKYKFKSPATDPFIRNIWNWLEKSSEKDQSFREWFEREFQKKFPDFNKEIE